MEYSKHLVQLLNLHKDAVILRQKWCDAPRQYWKLLDDDERLECFQQAPQDKVSRDLLPAWNMDATRGISTNLFSLLDFATGQELYRQAHKLSYKPLKDSGFTELVKELTKNARFCECRDFFTEKRSEIQDGKLKFRDCSQDINVLVKVFATMSPETAATIVEQLFSLHQNVYMALEYITQHMTENKTDKDVAKILEWQNKKASIWQVHIQKAVASAFADLENHQENFDHLAPLVQKVDVLAKIANRMKGAANRILNDVRNSNPSFVEALDRATRTQPSLLGDADAMQAQSESPSDSVSSAALFDVFQEPMQYSAVWEYLHHILEYLQHKTDNGIIRTLAVRELAEVCRFEFQRTKSALKCYAEVDLGPKLTELASAADNSGLIGQRAPVDESELDAMDDQLLAITVQLCRRTTEPQRAAKYLPKWHALRETQPRSMEVLSQDTRIALQQYAAIVYFTQKCTAIISMDYAHRFCKQSFVPKLDKLQQTLLEAKADFSLANVDEDDEMLVRKGIARTYFYEVEEFIKGATGSSLSAHYKELIEASIAQFKKRCASVAEELGGKVAVVFPLDGDERGDKPASKALKKNSTAAVREEEPKPRSEPASSSSNPELWGSDDEDHDASSPLDVFSSLSDEEDEEESDTTSSSDTGMDLPELERCLLRELAVLEMGQLPVRSGTRRDLRAMSSSESLRSASKRRRAL